MSRIVRFAIVLHRWQSRGVLMGATAVAAIALTSPAVSTAAVVAGSSAQRSNVPGLTSAQFVNAFVTRRGARLYVAGRPFRFAGANAESLGLRNYGPILSVGQKPGSERYATKYEVDDVLATLHEMGATVVRAQTIGDTIGCALCLEPSLGHFNARAFDELDMVVAQARLYGIKLIGEFAGDANSTEPWGKRPGGLLQSTDWYCVWNHVSEAACPAATFEDPRVLRDDERQMRTILDHVNPYTHLAYRDDPTFLGWVDGNNLGLANATPVAQVDNWLSKVSKYFKSIDHRQLFIDISESGGDYLPPADNLGLGPNLGSTPSTATLAIPGVDIYGQEWYPKDFAALHPSSPAATQLHVDARAIAAAHKVYATIEFGWDRGNMTSRSVLGRFLAGLAADRNVSGDLFWELVSHSSGHGWEAIPADENCTPTCSGFVEDGNWWALYYTGRSTAWNTSADMAARAQIIRTDAYAIDGFTHTPPHERAPAPIITSTRAGHVLFEGSAGAARYSIEKLAKGHWHTRCGHCTTDNDRGWQDPTHHAGCYRAIAYNLSGVASAASAPAGVGCAGSRHGRRTRTAEARPPWVGSWTASAADPGPLAGGIPLYASTGGRTVRDVLHLTLGGSRLRIHLSNLFGSQAVRFEDVRVAVSAGGAAIDPGSSRRVRFARQTAVTLGPGGQATSDPVDLPIHAGQNVAVSLYNSGSTGTPTTSGSLFHTNYVSGPGDAAGTSTAGAFPTTTDSWFWLSGIDVLSSNPNAGAIVALGDSITAGYASTRDANRDWVDLLADRLRHARSHAALSVLNAGIAGNNLHESSPCYGESALHRLKRDALDQPGVRYVIVDEGVNDITHPNEPQTAPLYQCLTHRKISAAGMIALFKLAIRRIHARHLKAIGVTLSPFGRYAYWTPAIEAERQTINQWIRTSHAYDGILDFDRVLRDPTHPAWLNPRYDSGDGLHPNDAGHAAMARSINLSLFAARA
jgi:mannan endo-1,4-beta-mannosidase